MESTHFVEPIASTVIDLGLKAALLIAFTGLAIRLLTRRRPAWSCLLWSATLGAVALLPLGTLLGPVLPWGQVPIPHFDGAWSLHTGPTSASLPPAAPITAGPAWWQWAVASLYLLGLAFALTRLGWGLWHLYRLRQSVHLVDAAPVEALRRQLGLHNPVQLGVSPLLQTPVLLGWRRPTIALPTALYAQCTPRALQDIIVHELVHLKRRDPLLNMLSQGVVALYWFHPLVHWAARSLVEMRECACDDWVVAQSGDPLTYAETLLHAAADQRPRLAMTMARSGRVAKRVERLLDPSHRPRPRVHGILGGGAVAMILILAGCMGGLGRGGETSGPQVQRWIITPPASGTVDSVKVQVHRDNTDAPLEISMQFPPHIRMKVTTPSDGSPVDSVKVQVLGSRADTLKVFMQRSPDIPIQVAAPVNTIMLKLLDDRIGPIPEYDPTVRPPPPPDSIHGPPQYPLHPLRPAQQIPPRLLRRPAGAHPAPRPLGQ